MGLKHIGTFENEDPGTRMYGRRDKFDELLRQADVIKGIMPDGAVRWAAGMNFNGGQCECCKDTDMSDFKTIEFYKEG